MLRTRLWKGTGAFAGKAVGKTWSGDLAEQIGVPFDELFNEKITEEPYAYVTKKKDFKM